MEVDDIFTTLECNGEYCWRFKGVLSLPPICSFNSRICWSNNLILLCYREIYWCGNWWGQREGQVLSQTCQSLSMNSLQFLEYIWKYFTLKKVSPFSFTYKAVNVHIEKKKSCPPPNKRHYLLLSTLVYFIFTNRSSQHVDNLIYLAC